MKPKQISILLCAASVGLGSAVALAACGEDRGGVEVQGGGTTGTTPSTTIPATTTEQ
jgi:hypothetical protein